jgi:membrane-associated phospholipid phosphatase
VSLNPWWLVVAGVGLLINGWSVGHARKPYISALESRVFHAFNGLPDRLYWLLWLPMQLGNLVVGTGAGLLVALVHRDVGVAVAVVLAMALKLVTERVIRRELAGYLSVRQRPGTSQVGAVLRGGDVPGSGPSFPSGHVMLVAGVSTVVAPILPAGWWWAPVLGTALVMLGRVYVGAHNPLDVTAGLGGGLLLGGVLAVFLD